MDLHIDRCPAVVVLGNDLWICIHSMECEMTPTNKLRFVQRIEIVDPDSRIGKAVRVLQQWWIPSDENYAEWVVKQPGEWRDVPMETEE